MEKDFVMINDLPNLIIVFCLILFFYFSNCRNAIYMLHLDYQYQKKKKKNKQDEISH